MAKFPQPPIATDLVGKPDSPGYPWERWFQAITNFLTTPQIPRATPVSSSAAGIDGQMTYDSSFLYVYDIMAKKWKRIALGSF